MTAEFLDTLFLGLLTYLVHSTVFLGLALVATSFQLLKNLSLKEMILRFALFGALLTTPLHLSGAFDAYFQPIGIPEQTLKSEPAQLGVNDPMTNDVLPMGTTPVVTTATRDLTPLAAGPLFITDKTEASIYTLANIALMIWALFGAALLMQLGYLIIDLKVQLAGRVTLKNGRSVTFARQLAKMAGIQTPFVSVKENLAGPFCLGSGEIVLPGWAEDLPSNQLKAMIAHEVAHIKRADPNWLLAARIVQSVFFFQPLNFVAAKRLSDLSEFACDAWAGKVCGSGMPLAECLAECAKRYLGKSPSVLSAAMATKSSPIVERTQMLLAGMRDYSNPASTVSKGAVIGAFILGGTMIPVFAFDVEGDQDFIAQQEFITEEEAMHLEEEKALHLKEEALHLEEEAEMLAEEAEMLVEQQFILAEKMDMLAEQELILFEEEEMLAEEALHLDEEVEMLAEEAEILIEQEFMLAEEAEMLLEQELILFEEEEKLAEEAEMLFEQEFTLFEEEEMLAEELKRLEEDELNSFKMAMAEGDGSSMSSYIIEDENGEMNIKLTTKWDGSTIKIRGKGRFEGNADETGFTNMDDGSYLDITEDNDGITRRVRYEGVDGQAEETFWLDGSKTSKDAAMTTWVAKILPDMYRRTGLDAEKRVKRIHANGGTGAVLDEMELIPGSYSLRKYGTYLVDLVQLNNKQTTRFMEVVENIGSSYDLRETLTAFVASQTLTDANWKAFVETSKGISSSYDLRETLTAAAENFSGPVENWRTLLEATKGITSSYDLRETLIRFKSAMPKDDKTMSLLAEVTGNITSSYDLRETLTAYAEEGGFGADGWMALLGAAEDVSDSYDLRSTLEVFAETMPRNDQLVVKYNQIAGGISGKHDREQALKALP